MTLRSADREVIRRQQAVIRFIDGAFRFACSDCAFWRAYATEAGAVNGAAAHLAGQHRIRLTLGKAS